MDVIVKPGKYVVAVSGGVDSVALLDVLMKSSLDISVTIAHFDHGMRSDSAEDAAFVANLAKRYDVPFISERADLGSGVSEAVARLARYEFLHRVRKERGAQAIMTAHHQDDVLETAIHNLLRGTGRLGLSSLKNNELLIRPLLRTPKSEILQYAAQHKLSWREDTTNYDERYTRNYIRHRLLVRFDANARQQLLALVNRQEFLNAEIDAILDGLLKKDLHRHWFMQLPHDVSKEVMAGWLRRQGISDFDRRTIERLVVASKTKPVGKRLDILHKRQIIIQKDNLIIE